MFSSLPPEILDFIVDHLHDEPSTLKSCCLVSKSWIPRIRRILFAKVEFSSDRCPIQLWMNAFPDPCNSPAHHTHVLHFIDHDSIAAASMVAFAWVQRFCHTNKLRIPNTSGSLLAPRAPGPLVQLRGLSPTLTSLHLLGVSAPLSEVLDLICSFPLLEDLFLHFVTTQGGSDRRYIPPTSPSLTGTLHMLELSPSLTRGLLDLPNGLHISRVTTWFPGGANSPEVDLISKCRNTLEDLTIDFSSPIHGLLDLSEAKRLKYVAFQCIELNVQWITATLRTAKPTVLRQITITVLSYDAPVNPDWETTHREWQDLDHLLDHLWTSRSIRPKITYREGMGNGSGNLVSSLLPKLASKGAVNRA